MCDDNIVSSSIPLQPDFLLQTGFQPRSHTRLRSWIMGDIFVTTFTFTKCLLFALICHPHHELTNIYTKQVLGCCVCSRRSSVPCEGFSWSLARRGCRSEQLRGAFEHHPKISVYHRKIHRLNWYSQQHLYVFPTLNTCGVSLQMVTTSESIAVRDLCWKPVCTCGERIGSQTTVSTVSCLNKTPAPIPLPYIGNRNLTQSYSADVTGEDAVQYVVYASEGG